MTTYAMVVVSNDGTNNTVTFTREELHQVLNALEIYNVEAAKYESDPVSEELTDKFEKICYDWTDWEDIEPDQEQRAVLQGSNE